MTRLRVRVGMQIRPYAGDSQALGALKERFERELGAIGGTDKEASYDGKLTGEYERAYLAWVERCIERDPGCVLVADPEGENPETTRKAPDSDAETGDSLAGYVFVLPEQLAFVWDAAVVNELYVRKAHRGTGLADDLMEAALDHARNQTLPLDRVVLDVGPQNNRARAFYDRHGFDHWAGMVARSL